MYVRAHILKRGNETCGMKGTWISFICMTPSNGAHEAASIYCCNIHGAQWKPSVFPCCRGRLCSRGIERSEHGGNDGCGWRVNVPLQDENEKDKNYKYFG